MIALKSWVQNSTDEDAELLYNNFSLLKKAAKVFPRILKPKTPNGISVYRGINPIGGELRSAVIKSKPEQWEKIKSAYPLYRYYEPIKYKPHRLVQSWSSNAYIVANTFAWNKRSIILSTKQTDDFLFNQDVLAYLYTDVDEREILHFGKTYKEDVYLYIQVPYYDELFGKTT